MTGEELYYATYVDGAFDDASADNVYDVADAVGAEFGPGLREDVLDRYSDHRARAATADAVRLQSAEIMAESDRMVGRIADRVGVSVSDVDSIIADALEGRPLGFDRLMSDYFGR